MSYENNLSPCGIIMCEPNGTKFLRKLIPSSLGQPATVANYRFDGQVYIPSGNEEVCDNCNIPSEVVCYLFEQEQQNTVANNWQTQTLNVVATSDVAFPSGAVVQFTMQIVSPGGAVNPIGVDFVTMHSIDGFTPVYRLSWDQGLTGEFSFLIGANEGIDPNTEFAVNPQPSRIEGNRYIYDMAPPNQQVEFTVTADGAADLISLELDELRTLTLGERTVQLQSYLDTCVDPPVPVYFDLQTGLEFQVPDNDNLGLCNDQKLETGCLTSPASVDLSSAIRCGVTRVTVGGDTIFFDPPLAPNWLVAELVDAINAERPGLVESDGASVVIRPGQTFGSIEIFCDTADFTEGFGTGGANGSRVSTPNTTYTFDNNDAIQDGSYAITSFGDTGLAAFNNASGSITTDSQGDSNGNAIIFNADFDPGEFYRQQASGLVVGEEYSVTFFAINTAFGDGQILPDVRVDIEDLASNVLSSFSTGTIPWTNDGVWIQYAFDFIATTTDVEFVLVNNAPGGGGNDLAIDQIQFNRVEREFFQMLPRGSLIPVEVVKNITFDGRVRSLRTFSPDGNIEYPDPHPDGLILTVGDCPTVSIETAGEGGFLAFADVCMTLGGTLPRQPGVMREDENGMTFLDVDGNVVIPTAWTPGKCPEFDLEMIEYGCYIAHTAGTGYDIGDVLTYYIGTTNGNFDSPTKRLWHNVTQNTTVFYADLDVNVNNGALPLIGDLNTCENPPPITLVQTDGIETADFVIPTGTVAYSVIVLNGTADINGEQGEAGFSLNQSPLSFGRNLILYPEISVTNVTGSVRAVYLELP